MCFDNYFSHTNLCFLNYYPVSPIFLLRYPGAYYVRSRLPNKLYSLFYHPSTSPFQPLLPNRPHNSPLNPLHIPPHLHKYSSKPFLPIRRTLYPLPSLLSTTTPPPSHPHKALTPNQIKLHKTGLLYGLPDTQCHRSFSLNPNINSASVRGPASFNRLRASSHARPCRPRKLTFMVLSICGFGFYILSNYIYILLLL